MMALFLDPVQDSIATQLNSLAEISDISVRNYNLFMHANQQGFASNAHYAPHPPPAAAPQGLLLLLTTQRELRSSPLYTIIHDGRGIWAGKSPASTMPSAVDKNSGCTQALRTKVTGAP